MQDDWLYYVLDGYRHDNFHVYQQRILERMYHFTAYYMRLQSFLPLNFWKYKECQNIFL